MELILTPIAGEYLTGPGIRPVHRSAIRRGEHLAVAGTAYVITGLDGLTLTLTAAAGRVRAAAERRGWDELDSDSD